MLQKVCLLFLLVLTVECVRNSRQDGFRRETGKRGNRGDVFENLFNIYDPSYLSVVWPKITNGVHLLLEMSCWDDMTEFFKDLSEGRAWAYDAVDASGRYQSALFAGSRLWLGSKEECLQLDVKSQENPDNETLALLKNSEYLTSVLRRQKYFDAELNDWRWIARHDEVMQRLVAADHRPPYRMAYTTLQIQLNLTKITMVKSYDIILGVCLPQSCPRDDVESIINFSIMLNDNLKSNKTIPRSTKITSSRQISGAYHIEKDAGAILLIVVTLLLVTVSTIATLVDFNLLKCIRYRKQSMSFDLPTYNNSETKLVDEMKRKHNDIMSVDDILAQGALKLTPINKMPRSLAGPPITLDVVNVDRMSGSCNRCGKYKRQCPNNKQQDNLPACPRVKYSSFASLSTEDRRKKHFFCRLLLCFSMSYCWKRMFNKNTANKDLSLIHILRISATLWIIFVHVAIVVGYTTLGAATNVNERDSIYNILASGTIAFDTLFFVSGVFSSHHFFYLKSRYSVMELVSFGGACGQCMQFVCFVTNRVIRLLPSYMYTILLSGVIARVSRSSSALVLPDGDHRNCAAYWWRNMLYITNAYPEDEQCMQVSWYLSTETQLHAVGALACAASMSASLRARLVVVTAAAFALAATAADVSEAYFETGYHYVDAFSGYSAVVVRPWARVAPYFVGVLAGWLVHALHGRLNLTKVTSALLWGASVPLVGGSAALPWAGPAWLAAWVHLAWPFGLLWPVLVCSTHYVARFRGVMLCGGAALSRLCYSMLLLHGVVARLLLLSEGALCDHAACLEKNPCRHWKRKHAIRMMWMYFTGTACVTAAAGLLLSLLIEMPCCGLFRRLSDCAT